MEINDVKRIGIQQHLEKVYFYLSNGKTVIRHMREQHIANARRIGRISGESAQIAEFVRLFNSLYSKPDTFVKTSAEENRYFELVAMDELGILTEEQEYEMIDLENRDCF